MEPDESSLVATLSAKIEQVRTDLSGAREAERWTALGDLHRLEVKLILELEAAREARRAREEQAGQRLTDAEVLAQVVELVPLLADDAFDVLAGAVDRRRRGGR